MILIEARWKEIREKFSEDDKTAIRTAITGEIICPRGWTVDIGKLSVDLRQRLFADRSKRSREV